MHSAVSNREAESQGPYPLIQPMSTLMSVVLFIIKLIVYRVPGFLSSRPHLVPPPPDRQMSAASSPLGPRGKIHSLTGKGTQFGSLVLFTCSGKPPALVKIAIAAVTHIP
jgi:hypothetical protein